MTMRIVATILASISLLMVGCEKQKSESPQPRTKPPKEKSESPQSPSQKVTPAFAPSFETIQGEWYVVATNPAIAGRIITDYITFGFRPDGTVIRTVRSGGETETQKGQYSWDAETRQIEGKFDLGGAGVQTWTWCQDTPGKATIVYWKNLTHGHERREDDVYIKRGTDEWEQRQKESLNTDTSVAFIDPFDLEVGGSYRLTDETPLMPHYDPPDPMAALKAARKIPRGSVIKILSRSEKGRTTWYKIRQGPNEGWISSLALVGQSLEKL